jgi:hypothetical protein
MNKAEESDYSVQQQPRHDAYDCFVSQSEKIILVCGDFM